MTARYESAWTKSTDGIHRLYIYTWMPAGKCRGVIQIIHGMREHMERYADFANFCCAQGFAVCGHDQLGHGKTAQRLEDYGYFGEQNGHRYLVSDAGKITRILKKRFEGLPLFLLGHSMGSLIGRLHILRHADSLSGFICMATSAEVTPAPAWSILAHLFSAARRPDLGTELLLDLVVYYKMKQTSKHLADMHWLSRDPDVGKQFLEHRHSKAPFTNRALRDLAMLQMAATSKDWAVHVDRELPILLLSGADDIIGEYGKGVSQTGERLMLAGVRDVSFRLYPGARHELLNEQNREEVYYDICSWIEKRLPAEYRAG